MVKEGLGWVYSYMPQKYIWVKGPENYTVCANPCCLGLCNKHTLMSPKLWNGAIPTHRLLLCLSDAQLFIWHSPASLICSFCTTQAIKLTTLFPTLPSNWTVQVLSHRTWKTEEGQKFLSTASGCFLQKAEASNMLVSRELAGIAVVPSWTQDPSYDVHSRTEWTKGFLGGLEEQALGWASETKSQTLTPSFLLGSCSLCHGQSRSSNQGCWVCSFSPRMEKLLPKSMEIVVRPTSLLKSSYHSSSMLPYCGNTAWKIFIRFSVCAFMWMYCRYWTTSQRYIHFSRDC